MIANKKMKKKVKRKKTAVENEEGNAKKTKTELELPEERKKETIL